ncbi:COMM domain-containing protein 8-like isoform X2 [Sabethes cyaneus]|uniref:COMM domain-containing protein 8-like isoform X2 n=1 Tax=Sabethes cyaneus TaxID=53552 RepID=UPI00237E2029|nr:COMM domain-containing protein 8-like isoform X2 [Sabethes cyaneus]
MHNLLINISSEQDFKQIAHLLIDYLLEVPRTDVTRRKVCSLLNLPAGGDDFSFTIKLIESVFRQYCLNEINEAELKSHFQALNQDMQQTLLRTVEQRKSEIAQFLINEINAKDNLLMESFDWDVKWIMGNSSLASVREQIATVALNCRGKDHRLKTVRFEMNRDKLNHFIEQLEKCDLESLDMIKDKM